MPTSAAGSSRGLSLSVTRRPRPPRRARAAAFTLIELLVVIAIVAMAMSGVALALRDSGQDTLDREAERLAALFEAARAQSRASGAPVFWHLREQGFVFEGVEPGALPDHWLANDVQVSAIVANGRGATALQLGPEPILAAQAVILVNPQVAGQLRVVSSDGLRPFAVSTEWQP